MPGWVSAVPRWWLKTGCQSSATQAVSHELERAQKKYGNGCKTYAAVGFGAAVED